MRTLALLGFLLLGSAVLVGCGAPAKCGPGSCSGCCDATGQCQAGNSNLACGTGGLICGACNLGTTCNLGLCASSGTGGGSSSGGGGGSATGGGGGGGGSATGGGGGSATGGGGGITGGGSGGGSGSSFETWCGTYVNTICDVAARCGLYSSASICRSSVGTSLTCATTPALRDGRTAFDSSIAASCRSQLSTAACDAVDVFTACAPALHGTVALNGACYGANECANNLYCDSGSTCPGVCLASVAIGQSTTGGASCVTGAVSYNSVCVAPTPVGQSCAPTGGSNSDRPCVASAFCSSTRVCTAKRLSAQSCTPGSYSECAGLLQCTGGFCGGLGALSASCDSTRRCMGDLQCGATNVCVALGSINTACSSPSGQCQPNLICDVPAGMTTGTCQAIHTIGQPCTYFGYQCGFSSQLYCTATSSAMSGVCAMQKGPGASCQTYAECTSNTCTNSVCAGCADPTP